MHAHLRHTRWLAVVACLAAPTFALAAAHPGRPARTTPLTDANIVAIVEAANTGDATNGKLALGITTDSAVKAFAQMMVTDHTSANEKLKATSRKDGLHAVPNGTSRGLVRSATAKHDELARLHGAAFDHAYMDAEVTVHQAVLTLLDEKLIPAAQNTDLKAYLESVRPVIAEHLEKAKAAQANLKG